MRDYGQVQCSLWGHPDFRSMSDDGRQLLLFLMTGPHSNGLGCSRVPLMYIAADLGWEIERVSETVSETVSKGWIRRCESTDFVLIRNYLRWNPVANPKVAAARQREFEEIPRQFQHFQELASQMLRDCNRWANPFETVLETLSKQEPEPEPEPNQNRTDCDSLRSSLARSSNSLDESDCDPPPSDPRCAEGADPPAELALDGGAVVAIAEPVITIPCVGSGPGEFAVTPEKLAEYAAAFPGRVGAGGSRSVRPCTRPPTSLPTPATDHSFCFPSSGRCALPARCPTGTQTTTGPPLPSSNTWSTR